MTTSPLPRRSVWFDAGLAAVFFCACETETIVDWTERRAVAWPLPTVIFAAAAMTVPLIWRRRAVLASALTTMVGVLLLESALSGIAFLNTPQFALFIPPYTLGAYADRRRALIGLAACLATVSVSGPSPLSSHVFAIAAVTAAWGAGRFMRGHRRVAADLNRTAARIAEERDALELLAVAEQRTRIAAELQEVVADNLSTMIVLARSARELIATDLDRADQGMERIEETGRAALEEMRRILGVLRHTGDEVELAPAPGIGQVATLIDASRASGRAITLQVRGDPRSVPATVDLAVYRIVDDALSTSGDVAGGVAVDLVFATDRIDLAVALDGGCLAWPTPTMADLTGLCSGQLDVSRAPDGGERVVVQLPTVLDGVPA